jgi:predicted small lipoprotein YifL
MKRRFSIILYLILLLALSVCGLTTAGLAFPPSVYASIQTPTVPGCSSGEVPAPEVGAPYSPPLEAASITPFSCDEIGGEFAYDPQSPLDIQEVGSRREEGMTIIDLSYASPMGGIVPSTLVVPDGAGPFAGMLYMHGMPDTRQTWILAAVTYARMGAVVLLIDSPFARRADDPESTIIFGEQDRRDQIQLIVDLRRGIDLLLSRPDVDPKRLTYIGYSYGGLMGGLLAGVEHGLKAYVLQVAIGGLVTHLTGSMDRGRFQSMSEDLRRKWVAWMWPIEPIHYVGCASPAAILFQNGMLDVYSLPADALRYQEAASEPKTIRWYQVGHKLVYDAAAFRDQAEWLAQEIGISVGQLSVPVDPQIMAAYVGQYQFNVPETDGMR